MHITFELETALQREFKVLLFVRHNSHYQMETNYLVFQNFCIHLPFSDFSSPCKSLQECCSLQTQNSRMSLTDSKRTQKCAVTVLYYSRWQSHCNTTFRHKEYSKLFKHKQKSYHKFLWTHSQIYYTQASLAPFEETNEINVWVVNPQLNKFFLFKWENLLSH